MSGQTNSRYRKQRFPRLERRRLVTPTNSISPVDDVESDDDSLCLPKRARTLPTKIIRPAKRDTKDSTSATRLDKRARDEHNEQERSRRRELAVIYELIRCSFSNDDLRHLGPCNGPKSIDKLSYPQVLQIAYQLVREEQHNLILFENALNDVKLIEKELVRLGIPVPDRPTYPSMIDNYRKVVQIVDNLLKHDKSARSSDGVYELSPAERAALGHREISFLRQQSQRSVTNQYSNSCYNDRKTLTSNMNAYNGDSFIDKDDCQSPWYSGSSHDPVIKRSSSAASMDYVDDIDINLQPASPFSVNPTRSTKQWFYDDVDDSVQDIGNENFVTLTFHRN